MNVTVERVRGHPFPLRRVESFEDLKDRGSHVLNMRIATLWKLTIGNDDLNSENFLSQLSPNKKVVFWTKLDEIMESLEVEVEDDDDARCIYHFFEIQFRGNISDKKRDDEGWFEGLAPSKYSKSGYMRVKASSRIRNYFDKVVHALRDINHYSQVGEVLGEFSARLHENRRHNTMFLVAGRDADRICDKEGKFRCQGAYDQGSCPFYHIINPYRTREGRLQFQLWELDHRIEKSFVIKKLKDAITNNTERRQINTDYFYNLLFTTENLQLVFTICHDRNPRDDFNSEFFDEDQVYLQEA